MKGLSVGILENKRIGNCSNFGISSRCKNVTIVGDGIAEVFEPTPDAPAVRLVRRNLRGRDYIHAEPIDRPNGVGWMFGGCFIYCSDSRFPADYPIPLHDRCESQELYNTLSR